MFQCHDIVIHVKRISNIMSLNKRGDDAVNPKMLFRKLALFGLSLGASNQNCKKTTIRKEINDVSDSEWKMIVETIQKAQNTPEKDHPDQISVWEAGADLHKELSASSTETIHGSCLFLFWHRVFLVEMEKNLQDINPDFFFPYWDSAKQWGDIENAPVWKYFGTKGNPIQNGRKWNK